jgi:ABC-type lipoprotein release transport system permease subunit
MFTLRLAWRNVWRNKRRSAIMLTAVVVGIAGVVLSMAVNNGMIFQMVDTAIATELGHVQIHAPGYEENPGLEVRFADGGREARAALESMGGVRAWAPRVRSEALVFSPRASVGVQVVGIDPEREAQVSLVARSIVDGRYVDVERDLLMGTALARRLQVSVGAKIVISAQDVDGDLVGEAYRVTGIFQTASRDFDQRTVFVPLDNAQKLLRLGDGVSEIVVLATRRRDVGKLAAALATHLGAHAEIRTWEELAPLLVQLIEVFDSTAWYVYAAVFVGMVFGIANVLLMAVYERIREIGVIMALGMRPRRLVAMIVLEATVLTFIGLLIGFGVAVASVAALHDGIDLSRWAEGLTAYGIGTRIVPIIRVQDVAVPIAAAVITAIVASLWPAYRATRFRPAEAVRYI